MSYSSSRVGHCEICGCGLNDHKFGICKGYDYNKRSKHWTRCKFEWSQCSTAVHQETNIDDDGIATYVDCLTCPGHPGGKPQNLHELGVKTASEWGIPRPKLTQDKDGRKSTKGSKKSHGTSSSSTSSSAKRKGTAKHSDHPQYYPAVVEEEEREEEKRDEGDREGEDNDEQSQGMTTDYATDKGKGPATCEDDLQYQNTFQQPVIPNQDQWEPAAQEAEDDDDDPLTSAIARWGFGNQNNAAASSNAVPSQRIYVDTYSKKGSSHVYFTYNGNEVDCRVSEWDWFIDDYNVETCEYEDEYGQVFYTYELPSAGDDGEYGGNKRKLKSKTKHKSSQRGKKK